MTDFSREIRDLAVRKLEDLDVTDVVSLVSHLPKLVQWFRSRRHDSKAIEADFRTILAELGQSADAARARLDERFPDQTPKPDGAE